jgi:hypothetical protein
MPASVSGAGGHNAAFAVARVLLLGFDLPMHEARALFAEFNARCEPPWSEHEIEHKLTQANAQSGFSTQDGTQPRGYLRDQGGRDSRDPAPEKTTPHPAQPKKPEFDPAKLERVAGAWGKTVDLLWLANRSALDPALVKPAKFLSMLYKPGEKVIVFTNDKTQGEAVWPGEELPTTGPRGVWFLCQPVTGQYLPNPRGKVRADGTLPASRRIEECVTDWRFMVLESDEAPARHWLGALVQLPLRIAAIYTSGGRSVHALVRLDARTKPEWDAQKHAMKAGLVILGADPGAMSAVRLTRLPGTMREGKDTASAQGIRSYEKFETPAPQKLLYLNPEAPMRPLCDLLARRDVEGDWLKLAAAGVPDTATDGAQWILDGLAYYSNVSRPLRQALSRFGKDPAEFAEPEPPPEPARFAIRWNGPGDEAWFCRVWSAPNRETGERKRKWDFEPGGIKVAETFLSETAALAAYDAAGIAGRQYCAVVPVVPA